jgi:hypothetical protein
MKKALTIWHRPLQDAQPVGLRTRIQQKQQTGTKKALYIWVMKMRYDNDLTTKQWNMIKHLFGKENRGRHLRVHSKRKLAIHTTDVIKDISRSLSWR